MGLRVGLAWTGLALGLLGCSTSSSGGAQPGDAGTDGPDLADWDRPIVRPDDGTATASRAACSYARGALPGETLGASVPVDKDIPIQTIVVLVQENRSFDSYFAHLGAYAGRTDIDSAPDSTTNPELIGSPSSQQHPFVHAPHLCALDTNHEWAGTHLEYDDGKMDGFYQANTGWGDPPDAAPPAVSDPDRALWWYDQRDIPFYYALASTFAIGDRYFSSLLGPTWPNRDYLYMATSLGVTNEAFPDLTDFTFPQNDALIFDELEKRHVTWNLYFDGIPPEAGAAGPNILSRWGRDPSRRMADFFAQAQSGTLPQVAFVSAVFGHDGPGANDEHPPSDIQY
ncbi:MAG TPA: alkaline phosphatase family protein, partial [Polyangiaceae bacterium]